MLLKNKKKKTKKGKKKNHHQIIKNCLKKKQKTKTRNQYKITNFTSPFLFKTPYVKQYLLVFDNSFHKKETKTKLRK